MDGKKTYLVAATAILGALSAALAGSMTWPEALGVIVPAALGVTLRHGITTEAAKGAV